MNTPDSIQNNICKGVIYRCLQHLFSKKQTSIFTKSIRKEHD